jgi:hypothetical protein
MLLAHKHVPIYGNENVRDVRAHFEHFAEIADKHNLVDLGGHFVGDCRAKEARGVQQTVVYRIESIEKAENAVEE